MICPQGAQSTAIAQTMTMEDCIFATVLLGNGLLFLGMRSVSTALAGGIRA